MYDMNSSPNDGLQVLDILNYALYIAIILWEIK